jgi:8-oxo-dGTP pyrophosphatase MutT (NUDIX family)
LRSAQLRNHSGQISFPGGRVDADEAPRDAALRELHEEIGVTVDPSNVLGALTDLFVPPSNSAIVPYVVRLPSAVTYHINEAEVQEVFTVPLRTFLTDDLRRTSPRTLNGITVDVPYWDVHPGQHLWGATAMILNELLWIVNDISL